MSAKDVFEDAVKTATGKELSAFKDKPKELADELNKDRTLKAMFRTAVAEANEESPEDAAMAGMASLFDPQ